MGTDAAQPNLNDQIRTSIRRNADASGGLRKLAERSGHSYNAIWGQMNRGQGVRADILPDIINATGDITLLELLAERCGCMIAPRPSGRHGAADIRKSGVGLTIRLGEALRTIEDALADGAVSGRERDEIWKRLTRLCAESVELRESFGRSR